MRVLLLLQVGFALLSALGSALISLFTGFGLLLLPMIAVTAGGATLLLVLIGRLERGSRRARRLVVWGEASVLLFAVVDLALAIGLAHAPLDLGPVLTRFVLPLAVIRLLRREREPRPVTPDVVKAAA